mmetsp:Transcript_34380/g.95051  ORF Transcript_34380/g.95051 Transcript_34380/m.95051 type:complete len:363 (+) Transcript_34380:391-1479(+)
MQVARDLSVHRWLVSFQRSVPPHLSRVERHAVRHAGVRPLVAGRQWAARSARHAAVRRRTEARRGVVQPVVVRRHRRRPVRVIQRWPVHWRRSVRRPVRVVGRPAVRVVVNHRRSAEGTPGRRSTGSKPPWRWRATRRVEAAPWWRKPRWGAAHRRRRSRGAAVRARVVPRRRRRWPRRGSWWAARRCRRRGVPRPWRGAHGRWWGGGAACSCGAGGIGASVGTLIGSATFRRSCGWRWALACLARWRAVAFCTRWTAAWRCRRWRGATRRARCRSVAWLGWCRRWVLRRVLLRRLRGLCSPICRGPLSVTAVTSTPLLAPTRVGASLPSLFLQEVLQAQVQFPLNLPDGRPHGTGPYQAKA